MMTQVRLFMFFLLSSLLGLSSPNLQFYFVDIDLNFESISICPVFHIDITDFVVKL